MTRYKQGKKVSEQKRIVRKTNLKRVALALLLALVGLVIYVLSYQYTHQAKIEAELRAKQTQVQSQIQQIKAKSNLNAEQQKQIEELNKQKQELEKQLQAKKESARVLAEAQATQQVAGAVAVRTAVSGSCADWIAQAGVTDVGNAVELIRRESGCNPNAVNRSSGACGIAQELPCGKSGCGLGNPVCQIKWMQQYVNARYGGWGGAIAWHNSHSWY